MINHETWVYWPIFCIQTGFYQFLGTKNFGQNYAKSRFYTSSQMPPKSSKIWMKNARKNVFHLKSSLKYVFVIVWHNCQPKEKNRTFKKVVSEKIEFWLFTNIWVFFSNLVFVQHENWLFAVISCALCGTVTSMRCRKTLEPVVPCWMFIFGRKMSHFLLQNTLKKCCSKQHDNTKILQFWMFVKIMKTTYTALLSVLKVICTA